MFSLLHLQFYRLLRDKAMIIQTIFTGIIGVLLPVILCGIQILVTKTIGSESPSPNLSFMSISGLILFSFVLFYFPMIMFYTMFNSFMGREIGYGTRRNIIVSGYSKTQIFYSNAIFIFVVGTILLVLYQLISLIIGLCFNLPFFLNEGSSGAEFAGIYFINLLIIYVSLAFVCMVGMLIQSMGLSNTIVIIVPVAGSVIVMLAVTTLSMLGDFTATYQPFLQYLYFYQAFCYTFENKYAIPMYYNPASTIEFINNNLMIITLVTCPILIALQLVFGGLVYSKMDQK